MATSTERFGFTLPSGQDPASIIPLNLNTQNIERYLGMTQDMIAPMYDDTATYDVGDIVTYESNLYKCITAISTAEPFDSTKWTVTSIEQIIDGVKGDITQLNSSLTQLNGLTVYRNLTPQTSYASFNDGSNLPMYKLLSNIEPVQDLHGYDAPWVGGAGKNKLNYDLWKGRLITRGTAVWENNGVTLTATESDCYTDFTFKNAIVSVSEGEIVKLSWEESTNKSGYVFIFPNGSATGSVNVNNNTVKEISYTVPSDVTYISFRFGVTNTGNTISYKNIMIRKSGDATFAPYSNICPISGWTEANITVADDVDNPTVSNTYTIDFVDGSNPLTVYGGTLEVVSGQLTVTNGYIASYNAETLPSTWISDRDVYAEGTTPTTGAEVVYELATPQTYQLTPTQVNSLIGQNYIFSDTGNITNVKYIGVLNFS